MTCPGILLPCQLQTTKPTSRWLHLLSALASVYPYVPRSLFVKSLSLPSFADLVGEQAFVSSVNPFSQIVTLNICLSVHRPQIVPEEKLISLLGSFSRADPYLHDLGRVDELVSTDENTPCTEYLFFAGRSELKLCRSSEASIFTPFGLTYDGTSKGEIIMRWRGHTSIPCLTRKTRGVPESLSGISKEGMNRLVKISVLAEFYLNETCYRRNKFK